MTFDFQRGRFRVRGDVVEIFPASRDEHAFRVEFFGDEIDRIREVEALTGQSWEKWIIWRFSLRHTL